MPERTTILQALDVTVGRAVPLGLLRKGGPAPNNCQMSVMSRLREFLGDVVDENVATTDEQLTVATLLTLVTHADGRTLPVEIQGLHVLLRTWFDLPSDATARILAKVGEIEAGIDPATTLVDRILHDVEPAERMPLLALAYRIAAVDGFVHEFEDNLIWRTGRLLGFSDPQLATIKADALKNLAPGQARD